ncbi:MAG: tRNA (adenosine(37)-N6)-threonylcarbamoyltransferase complex ATPase subunit type 1 TsaE [Nitrospinaceae bacterium]
MEIITRNREETLALGKNLGESLQPGDIVLLFGDLGAGKTTFTQGIAHGLGMPKTEYVRSPTFTLVNEYQAKYPIYHIDLFRTESFAEIENLGLEEFLFGQGISVVEWAEKLYYSGKDSPSPGFGICSRIEVRISFTKENHRVFDIQWINMDQRPSSLFSLQ